MIPRNVVAREAIEDLSPRRVFREFPFEVRSDPKALRQAIDEHRPLGEATILVAAHNVIDTAVAWGNKTRQVIDQGAFREYTQQQPFPMQKFFLDHGDAPIRGAYSARLLIGKVPAARESAEGLEIDVIYSLRTQAGRDAFAQLLDLPEVVSFSFMDWIDEEEIEVRDGIEHVTRMWPIEFSQVGEGAQDRVRLIAARSAISAHSTSTSDAPWDAGVNEKAYPAEAAALRAVYAWRDPDGDPTAKGSYKFPHHFADGKAASLRACSSGIGVLNGGRGGASIPAGDRQGIYTHLARHIRDGDREVPALRSAVWTAEEIREYMGAPDFMQAFGEVLVSDRERAEDVRRAVEAALSTEGGAGDGNGAADEPDPVNAFYRQLFK